MKSKSASYPGARGLRMRLKINLLLRLVVIQYKRFNLPIIVSLACCCTYFRIVNCILSVFMLGSTTIALPLCNTFLVWIKKRDCMWEHFFTHENTVPHSYNTGILIVHTKYPHPHAAVSIIFLLFLALLLHNVFSQKSPDNNCTITDGPFHIARMPRIGCTAQSCLSCNQAKAECLHNTTSNTFTCTANTSTCSVQL